MVDKAKSIAPYAPLKSVLGVISRRRDRGLPDTVTNETLESIGIPAGNAPRTLFALKFLGLLNEDETQAESFVRLAKATQDEYPKVLGDIVRAAYQPIFTVTDPSQDDDIRINDAFKQYEPFAQRNRMVSLFHGLCEEAHIIEKSAHKRSGAVARQTTASPVRTRTMPTIAKGAPGVVLQDEITKKKESDSPQVDYRFVSVIMQQLPADGRWSRAKREKWLQALTAAVDLLVEVKEEQTQGTVPQMVSAGGTDKKG